MADDDEMREVYNEMLGDANKLDADKFGRPPIHSRTWRCDSLINYCTRPLIHSSTDNLTMLCGSPAGWLTQKFFDDGPGEEVFDSGMAMITNGPVDFSEESQEKFRSTAVSKIKGAARYRWDTQQTAVFPGLNSFTAVQASGRPALQLLRQRRQRRHHLRGVQGHCGHLRKGTVTHVPAKGLK